MLRALRLQGTSPEPRAQCSEVSFSPWLSSGAPSSAAGIDLSLWLFCLAVVCSSPPPSGPPLLIPFCLLYPCADAAAAVGTPPDALSTTSSPNWRAFRRNALICFSFIWASYSSWLRRTYVIPCFNAR